MNGKQLDIFDILEGPSFILHSEVFPEAESDEIEYKSAQGGLPKSLWETYSAFANTSGGIIILGIVEKKGQPKVEGLSDEQIEKLQIDFWNQINNKKNVSSNILSNNHVQITSLNEKKVIAINVPQGSRAQKPVYLTQNPFSNTYKRNFEGDYKCTDEEVRRMMADADMHYQPDARILEGFSILDFDLNSIKQYRQIMSSVKPGHNWLALDDIEFLKMLGAYRVDRKTKKEGPTVGGILMFGKYQSIIDEACCPKFFPDYREYMSENPEMRWTDRVYADGTWETNLFQFYRTVWPKLSSKLPKPFQLIQGQRIDETPAHEALREAFVNTLVHTDYSAPGNIVIESRLDNFIFTNPGTLLVTIQQYYAGGISECRNNFLQKMFMMIGSAEKAGSGVSKIMSGWDSAHWWRPYLSIESLPDRLILNLPLLSTIPDETLDYLRSKFGEALQSLGKDELTVLSTCHIEGGVSNQRLQYFLDRHKSDITILLQELCKNGFLTSENKGRWTTYHLNDNFNSNEGRVVNEGSSANEGSSNEGSSANEGSSNRDSSINGDSSNRDSSRNRDSSTKVDNASNKHSVIDIQKSKMRFASEELIALIVKICNEYKSLEEIANEVSRTPKHLRNNIIPKMIEAGQLKKQYPDNHPNQKYIAAKEL